MNITACPICRTTLPDQKNAKRPIIDCPLCRRYRVCDEESLETLKKLNLRERAYLSLASRRAQIGSITELFHSDSNQQGIEWRLVEEENTRPLETTPTQLINEILKKTQGLQPWVESGSEDPDFPSCRLKQLRLSAVNSITAACSVLELLDSRSTIPSSSNETDSLKIRRFCLFNESLDLITSALDISNFHSNGQDIIDATKGVAIQGRSTEGMEITRELLPFN